MKSFLTTLASFTLGIGLASGCGSSDDGGARDDRDASADAHVDGKGGGSATGGTSGDSGIGGSSGVGGSSGSGGGSGDGGASGGANTGGAGGSAGAGGAGASGGAGGATGGSAGASGGTGGATGGTGGTGGATGGTGGATGGTGGTGGATGGTGGATGGTGGTGGATGGTGGATGGTGGATGGTGGATGGTGGATGGTGGTGGVGGAPTTWKIQTSNTTVDLGSVWGSTASAVWAVGKQGTTVLYNGSVWKVIPSGVTDIFQCVHGVAATSVYASTTNGKLFKFDGSGWSFVTKVNAYDSSCLFVTGPDEVLLAAYVANFGTKLYRVVQGVATEVGSLNNQVSGAYSMSGDSPNDVWVVGNDSLKWNGSTATTLGVYGFGSYVAAPTAVFLTDGLTADVRRWSGSPTTQLLNTGASGRLHGIHGTAAGRWFAVGGNFNTNTGMVLHYDGLGFTNVPLPTGVKFLRGVFATPTGEVFAVGNGGTIVIGT